MFSSHCLIYPSLKTAAYQINSAEHSEVIELDSICDANLKKRSFLEPALFANYKSFGQGFNMGLL